MMRSKALLVAALKGCQGPAVTLSGGEWEVESHPHIELVFGEEVDYENGGGIFRFKSSVRLRAVVSVDYKGPPIHLNAVQVA